MFSQQEIGFVRAQVEDLLGKKLTGDIRVEEGEGLTVTGDARSAVIAAESLSALARGFFRLAQETHFGRVPVGIREKRHFRSCGPYVDLSRNGVFTTEAARRYIASCAALGMNLLILYTEDTYEVPGYPYLGYLRGRLTRDEWRETDAYARALGVELVPCIQTLGHLENFLQWRASEPLQDQADILLADNEDTYAFLEAAIRSLRECVSTDTLHIGMDEADTVGLGRYFKLHGPVNRFEILERHLKRVVAICEKYGFRPIMWSDMFYRLGSKTNAYYDLEAEIPPEVISRLPKVELCYWDYYHREEKWYDHMLTEHEKFGQDTSFAGGVWVWSGFLPHIGLTRATMEPALKCCLKHGTKRVIATLWGDDGAETNPFLAMNQMPLFSEAMWRGRVPDREEAGETGAFLTGLSEKAFESFSLFYPDDRDRRVGKALIWCDLLYPRGPDDKELAAAAERSREALKILSDEEDREEVLYARALFEVCLMKAEMLPEVRRLYRDGDREGLRAFALERIPALIGKYDELKLRHRRQWEQAFKRNGWEVLALRYGGVKGRLEDVKDALICYADGELDTLCEMDEERLDPARKHGMQFYQVYVTPMCRL